MKPKIFISSPYTLGNVSENVRRQIQTADELMNLGFTPFTPLLYHFHDMFCPRDYEDWLAIDLEWMLVCDAVLRLPGESAGADREVMVAKEKNIPVFYDIEELIQNCLSL